MNQTNDHPSDKGPVAPATTSPTMSEGNQERAPLGVAGCLRAWLFSALLVAGTFIAYLPALRGKFVWDDDAWTTGISLLLRDASGLWTMWRKLGALQQYYPLARHDLWLDYKLWGFWTLPYHVENVLLHAFAALLFWRLLWRLQVPGAWLAGAIFALHPVMVESAGWITERKNVLSLVFYLGALLAYGRFARFWNADDRAAASTADSPAASGAPMVSFASVLWLPSCQRRPPFHCRQCSYWFAGGKAGASGGRRMCCRPCLSSPPPSALVW